MQLINSFILTGIVILPWLCLKGMLRRYENRKVTELFNNLWSIRNEWGTNLPSSDYVLEPNKIQIGSAPLTFLKSTNVVSPNYLWGVVNSNGELYRFIFILKSYIQRSDHCSISEYILVINYDRKISLVGVTKGKSIFKAFLNTSQLIHERYIEKRIPVA